MAPQESKNEENEAAEGAEGGGGGGGSGDEKKDAEEEEQQQQEKEDPGESESVAQDGEQPVSAQRAMATNKCGSYYLKFWRQWASSE